IVRPGERVRDDDQDDPQREATAVALAIRRGARAGTGEPERRDPQASQTSYLQRPGEGRDDDQRLRETPAHEQASQEAAERERVVVVGLPGSDVVGRMREKKPPGVELAGGERERGGRGHRHPEGQQSPPTAQGQERQQENGRQLERDGAAEPGAARSLTSRGPGGITGGDQDRQKDRRLAKLDVREQRWPEQEERENHPCLRSTSAAPGRRQQEGRQCAGRRDREQEP